MPNEPRPDLPAHASGQKAAGAMKVGSLFSGIGGLDLGLERAGMEIAWQVEIDEFCLKVLKKHWPEVPKYGDIRKIDPKELEPVDLIAGGFPSLDTVCSDLESIEYTVWPIS